MRQVADRNVKQRLILLTGATGYIGGRLLTCLEHEGYRVRCLSRRPESLEHKAGPSIEIARGDVLDAASVANALEGVHTAYYLVHSMGSDGVFEEEDRRAARVFGKAASEAGVERIVYLGGLGDTAESLSPHLRSRHEVGDTLRASGVQVIEFRASIVIGSGSCSFEMIRALVERLPVMIMPRWVSVLAQPIGIGDLLQYLMAVIGLPGRKHRIFEIGGADRVSYGDLMREYARQRNLRRFMIRVPVLTPHLSSLWLGLVTPLYARIGRKLVDSIRHPTVVYNDEALRVFGVKPQGVPAAITSALRNEDQDIAETRWSDSVASAGRPPDWGGVRFGSRLIDVRTARVTVGAAEAFWPIQRIGGAAGWYYATWLWKMRGFLDLLVGGVGVRRGRRHPSQIQVGDTIDWWRVEVFEPMCRLRLAAEMKLPGRAWLEFEVTGDTDHAVIRQTAVFEPVGLGGLVYWYGIYPLHRLIFVGMLRNIATSAVKRRRDAQPV